MTCRYITYSRITQINKPVITEYCLLNLSSCAVFVDMYKRLINLFYEQENADAYYIHFWDGSLIAQIHLVLCTNQVPGTYPVQGSERL